MHRRDVIVALAAVSSLGIARAQVAYPSKRITFICPYAAGGGSDQRSRQFSQYLADALKQPVIVDNRTGAGGNIGTRAIATAKPDGYVIGMGNFAPLAVNPSMFDNLQYDPEKDLAPICLLEKGPLVLMVPNNSAYRSVQDIVTAAKAKPGYLSFASGGQGGSHHLAGETFKSLAGISINHVPYRGGAPATTDLMGGQVDMMFEQLYSAAPNIRAKSLRALAITSKTRSPLFPEIPTMIEAGVPGFEVLNWQGIVGPAGLPRPIVAMLNALCNKGLADPTIKAQMLEQGNEIGGGTPEEFATFIHAESIKWGRLVREQNIKPT